MSDLPLGWTRTSLAEVGEWCSGGTPSRRNSAYFGHGIPWVKSGDLPDGPIRRTEEQITELGLNNSSAKLMPVGTISVALYGATIGKLGLTTFPAATNQACANVVPDTRLIDPQYLFYYLMAAKDALIDKGQGGAQPNISQQILKAHDILLAPINEQRRIADKLKKVLTRVNAAQERLATIPRLLKRFRHSVLAAAFTQDDNKNLRRLDEIFSVQTGGTPNRKNLAYYAGGTIPWVKTGEVQNCEIFAAEESITELALNNCNAKVFPAGTLLVAMYGEGKTRGQIARLRIEASTNQACAALVNPSLSQISNQYVFLYLLGQYQKLRAEAVGGNQPNLNLSTIKSWEIPFPGEARQQEIVENLEALFRTADALEVRYLKAKAHVDKLTQSILAKAFRGELVSQDPNDEPASILLERIRQQRNGNGAPTVRSKTKQSRR